MGQTRSAGRNRTKKKTRPLYSTGEKNKVIDSGVHPLIRVHPVFRLVDVLLHVLNEQNPGESLRKFIKYSLPELINELLGESD